MSATPHTIYLDNAATTRVAPEVIDVVVACMRDDYGNPSSAHALGITAEHRIKVARRHLLPAIGDDEGSLGALHWTSGGTEANALAVIGAARARANRGKHVVCSAIEHPAVLESMAMLEREQFQVSTIPVASDGTIDPQRVADAVTGDTTVVALMLVNNELGTVQPVREATLAARERRGGVHVHCDAVQALGKVPIDVGELGVDSLAVSGHKLHGPKGIGALWLRSGTRLQPLWAGGGQQRGVRSGTENVPGIAGFGEAVRLAMASMDANRARWSEASDALVHALADAGLGIRRHATDAPRAPHIVSLALPGVPAEPLLHALEQRGVLVSAGSACASKHKGPSHVLEAIGVPNDVATLRLSFGRDTTHDDVQRAGKALIDALRSL